MLFVDKQRKPLSSLAAFKKNNLVLYCLLSKLYFRLTVEHHIAKYQHSFVSIQVLASADMLIECACEVRSS